MKSSEQCLRIVLRCCGLTPIVNSVPENFSLAFPDQKRAESKKRENLQVQRITEWTDLEMTLKII